jgi:hypothetical protein
MMRRCAAALTLIALAGAASAENLVSGPQKGERIPGDFRVLFLSGDHAGEKGSPVSMKGSTPTALLFANDVSDPLTALLRRIDARLGEAATRGDDARAAFIVFGGDDARLKERLRDLVAKEKWKRVVVCCGPTDGIDKYEIADESELTAVILGDGSVKANFAFRKGEFSADWADAILKSLSEVLPK